MCATSSPWSSIATEPHQGLQGRVADRVRGRRPAGTHPSRLQAYGRPNLERAGVSRSVAMKLTGHKTEAVYRRYAIVSEQDLHEAAARLARGEHGRVIELGQVLGQVASASG